MGRVVIWRDLLTEKRIPFIERGPNVKRGEINIRCPFCGAADPSYHMGLNPETGYWACWRNESHRGKSPVRLLMSLLRVPFYEARKIAGLDNTYVDPDGFSAIAARILRGDPTETADRVSQTRFLRFPRSFRKIDAVDGWKYFRYLRDDRGFGPWTRKLIDDYQLMFDYGHGDWEYRVIFPFFVDTKLVAWTGRAIGSTRLRYRDLEIDECLIEPKHTFYNHDALLEGGKAVIVVEGPMDVLKLDYYGRRLGIRAVGLCTASMSEDQALILYEAAPLFERVYFMMDTASELDLVASIRMRGKVSHIPNSQPLVVPFDKKDAGALTTAEAEEFLDNLATELS